MLEPSSQRRDFSSAHVPGTIADDDELAAQWRELSVRYHKLQCAIDRALQADAQISSSEFETLEVLANIEGDHMRMSDLAGQVHLSQSALSRLISGLEKEGLVARDICTTDRRSLFVAITGAGRSRYDQARPIQRAILRADCSGDTLCGTEKFGSEKLNGEGQPV